MQFRLPNAPSKARALCTLAIALASCTQPSTPAPRETPTASGPPWFEEIAERAGLRFVHRSGHRDKFYLPEIMGGGAALFDMDHDGDLDLYLVQSGSLVANEPGGNRLYRNRGNGTFDDVTADSGAEVPRLRNGGGSRRRRQRQHADLLVTTLTGNLLLKGDGRGRFTDVTAKAGIASSGWRTSAAFLDYDADGWLDLFVVRYLNWQTSAEVECYSLSGTPDYCSPRTYDLPVRVHAVPQQRRRHVHRRVGSGGHPAAPSATAWALSPVTSTATAGSTCSWPTTARRITCG